LWFRGAGGADAVEPDPLVDVRDLVAFSAQEEQSNIVASGMVDEFGP